MAENLETAPFSLLIKPASAECNLNCTYCFYLDKSRLYPSSRPRRMNEATLEKLVQWYMATVQPAYVFGWQGGEPALMGHEFFRTAIRLQRKYSRPGAAVSNGIQTNATLVDDRLAACLAEYRFLAGVSLDGPQELHDHYRLTTDGQGSYRAAMKGIRALRRNGVEFNILVLVNAANVGRPREIYRFLKSEGFNYHQYIPCVEFDARDRLLPFSVTGRQWGSFLTEIFDEWYPGDTRSVSIRHFDSILEYLLNGRYNVCSMGGRCATYVVVEHNGDLYPCDFFVEPGRKVGSLHDIDFSKLRANGLFRSFASRKSRWNEACGRCGFLQLCSGDCLKHRPRGLERPENISVLCPGWKHFFSRTLDSFTELAAGLGRELHKEPTGLGRQWRPEDPCFCDSGRKYANCHGRILTSSVQTD
jgi:uncharacterized protein